jgi:hypothetical protein
MGLLANQKTFIIITKRNSKGTNMTWRKGRKGDTKTKQMNRQN